MAEINIERKKKKSSWPWLLVIIILLIVGYFVLDSFFEVEDGNIQTEPTEEEVIEGDELNYNKNSHQPDSELYAEAQANFFTL